MANTAKTTAPTPRTPSTRTRPAAARSATRAVDEAEHLAVTVPLLGDLQLPRPDQLAYYAGVTTLVVLGIMEWPAALVLGVGHVLLTQRHNRSVQQFAEALEET